MQGPQALDPERAIAGGAVDGRRGGGRGARARKVAVLRRHRPRHRRLRRPGVARGALLADFLVEASSLHVCSAYFVFLLCVHAMNHNLFAHVSACFNRCMQRALICILGVLTGNMLTGKGC